MEFISIKEAKSQGTGEVSLRGWVYRERGSKKLKFVVLRDSADIIQLVIEKEVIGEEAFLVADKLRLEASIEVSGTIKKDDRAPGGYEVAVKEFSVVGECADFPLGQDQSPEFLLDNRHLSIRTRKQAAILRIRSAYVQAREQFFREEGFFRFDTPILQPTQSEGGSTIFEVKYYQEKTYLAQTWQFYGEAGIFALEKIYNFGPTFRAEKSKTSRHLSEFWMAEMEAAWFKLKDVSEFAKKELKYCIKQTAERCRDDFIILEQDPDALIAMTEREWPTIKYREALALIKEKDGIEVPFGKDLRTEEEKAIMSHFDTPVCVTHYPVEAMGFYKPRDPENPDEALCFDMLAPQIGIEIVGGSERSLDVKDMEERLAADGEDITQYSWYMDLRRMGSVPHSGYGVGTERVLQWITGTENIKDCIPFPRTMLRFKP
ncbi:asparagine--tRNA ligase [Candidatus Woesearchaeota archaeon]|nr:asparagine--tRNA ligase [Candidatus Woesearchaeota archaeon]